MKKVVLVFLILIVISLVYAHQPNIVYKENLNTNIKIIQNPEISQAFYAELKGKPEYYKIISNEYFTLNLEMTLPFEEDFKKDWIFEVFFNNSSLVILNGTNFNWTKFYEQFANDDYLQGPKFEINSTPGEYLIKVSNLENVGKYVLVVGKKESFPFQIVWRTIYTIPQLKIYFGKNFLSAYFTIISLFFFWPSLIVLLALILIVSFLIKRFKKKSRKNLN